MTTKLYLNIQNETNDSDIPFDVLTQTFETNTNAQWNVYIALPISNCAFIRVNAFIIMCDNSNHGKK